MLSRFLTIFPLAGLAFATTGKDYRSACQAVETTISDTSKVYYPGEWSDYRCGETGAHVWAGDPQYIEGEYHFDASSQQDSACVVEPGTPEDVGKIVRSFRSVSPEMIAPRTH